MFRAKVCLTLTGSTLEENLSYVQKYRNWIDCAELRVDYLNQDERLHIRKFPLMAKIPLVLTIRRKIDGGLFVEGEATRTTLFARGLSFAEQDTRKNFAYVDFEEDFRVPSLQDASLAFGTRVIRSVHSIHGPIKNIAARVARLRITGYEIPKISFMPHTLDDITDLFHAAKEMQTTERILSAIGTLGLPARILATKLHSYFTYVSPTEMLHVPAALGHIDPITLSNVYRFETIDAATKLYGLTGYPLTYILSPEMHNTGYSKHGLNAVYIPIRAQLAEEAIRFANELDFQGLSVTVPHKERVLEFATEISAEAGEIGACNSLVRNADGWFGYNTDSIGLTRALTEFLNIKKLRGWRVSIIGSGGAARAAAYMVKMLSGSACIFNRTHMRSRSLAEHYGFEWAPLNEDFSDKVQRYSDLIIYCLPPLAIDGVAEAQDMLSFYEFNGHEALYDVNYGPEKSPMRERAIAAGCKVSNGFSMLQYQVQQQFQLFTGLDL